MSTATRKRRFTDQMVERLRRPATGRDEYADELCAGLILRVTERGHKSFSVIYKVPGEGGVSPAGRLLAGRQHRITLGSYPILGLGTAREKAREVITAATTGRDLRPERAQQNITRATNTFSSVLERFISQEIKPSVRSWANVERVLRIHVMTAWGDGSIADIRRTDVHALLDGLVVAGRAGTGREVRKHLHRLFEWAVDREIVTENPVRGLKRGDLAPTTDAGRALSDPELRAVWAAAGELGYPFGPLYRLLLLTGQRRGEWATARWADVNLGKQWLEVPRARHKGGRDHIVPLSESAMDLIGQIPHWQGADPFLLSTTAGRRPVSGFSKAKASLDALARDTLARQAPGSRWADFRVHDLRVTCETRLADLGFSREVRDAVLGHAKPGLQKTYNKHDYLAEKREALQAYGRKVMELVG